MKIDVHDVTPILNVSSVEESFAWFERLGWTRGWAWGEPPDFGAVYSGSTAIFLCRNGQGARGGAKPREPWDNQAGCTWMSWWLPTAAAVDALHAHALSLGVEAPWPPTDMPWEVHECHIRHPDGHTFRVSAPVAGGHEHPHSHEHPHEHPHDHAHEHEHPHEHPHAD